MRRLVGTAILCMLATIPAYAQQQQETSKAPERSGQHAEKPASKSPEKPVDKPSKPPKEAPVTTKSAPRHQQDQQQKQAQQQAKAEQKAQQNNQKAQEKQAKNQRHDQNANHGHAETADNAARGNKGEHRIPEDRYRADFGRAHTFHVRHDRNDRRFQFGGYWFEYTNAWPSDWNYDDNFYIVEIDGIDYLCDARFPDQRIVVVIEG